MERLSELATTAARRMVTSPFDSSDTDTTPPQQSCTSTIVTRPLQLQLQTPQHITPEQKLIVATAEWKKLLSKRDTATEARPPILSMSNHRENNFWGDELLEKGNKVTRVYSLNVNGLSIDRRGGKFDDLCKVAKEVQTDILCCQEHNLDTTKYQVRSILYDTSRQHWNRSRLISGTTPISFETNYKPGGTMIVSVGDITGRIIAQSHDKWGRWTSQTLRGSGGTNVTVVSAYQVVTDNPHTGLTTATSQQQSLLIQTNDALTPRRAFKRDLRSFLYSRRIQGDELLLVGDFNEVLGFEIDGMSQIAAEFQLLNLMQTRHHFKPPPTYSRGRRCLDYGLATHRVANALLRCGYDAFNERFATDHRAYYFDLDTEALFGNTTQQLAPHSHRVLKSNNIEQVTQYIKLKYDYLTNRNVHRRADQLSLPGDRHAFAERLDLDVLKASLDAEKNTKRFREPAWSVALSKARRTKIVLRKWLTMYRTGLDHSQILTRDITTYNLEMTLPASKEQCKQRLREIQAEITKIVAESYQQRDQERDARILELDHSLKKADKAHAQLLRRLKRNEKVKRVSEKIKASRDRGQRQGVTRLEIPRPPSADPKTCNDWQTIDIPSEIVEHLQHRNRQHFGQAQGTPFTIDPLANEMSFCGDSLTADSVLDGTYPTDRHPESVNLLLQHLKQTHEMASLQTYPTVSLEEFQGKLRAWRESTTTSPSGMHLGHYKALFAKHKYSNVPPLDPSLPDDDERSQEHNKLLELKEEYDHMQQTLAAVHLSLLNYALERGYSYKRWQCIANTILFKDPGSVKIHRTRVIHIYEADFNLMLGIKWRVALYQSEALKQLNEGQYGSRPRRNAIDPVMIEELQFEISRLSRRMFLQTNYDASACYDRIIPNLAMIASRRFGVDKSVTQANGNTLLNAKYHIRTELGLSESSYSHSSQMPIYGTGQGSGNSPMIWCFLSSILYDCYDLKAHPAQYCNPDWTNQCKISMVGFVDDSNGQVNAFYAPENAETLQEMVRQARTNAITWSDLLQATGGALELSKCSYHVMAWKFSIQGAPVLSNIKSELPPLEVSDPLSDTIHSLEFLPPSVAHKTLGHYKEPFGLQKTQFRKLKEKSDQITEFLWSTYFTREEAWTFYRSCYVPAVTYPLTSSFLSNSQLKAIQTKAMTIITAKCGFNRHTKSEVLYGPRNLGGADFCHLQVQQGIGQTTYFLRHWRSQSSVGKLLKCTMAWAQLTAGVSYSIMERTEDPLPHLESKWLASIRTFLASISASLHLDDPGIPPLQREHDWYLMDMIIHSARFSPLEIRKLNYCRLYLQAVTLADISKPNGQELDPCFLLGTSSLHSGHTRWHTVHQDRPSEQEWKLWRSANRIWSDQQGCLLQPLGAWIHPVQTRRFQYFAYRHRRSLFIRTSSNAYATFRQHNQRTYRPSSAQTMRTFAQLPERASPAEVALEANGFWSLIGTPSKSLRLPGTPTSATATFDLFIETLEPWETELLRHVTMSVDPFSLCLDLTPGFRAVSDGSVTLKQHGSFGWVVSSMEGVRLATGNGPVRGRRPHSYRAEAYGILSFLRFLLRIKEFTGMHEPWQGLLATDSLGVLDTLKLGDHDVQENDDPIDLDQGAVVLDCLRPDWDVLIEIQSALQSLPRVRLQHVEGHQDRKQPYQNLDLLGQLNVDADAQAGMYNLEYGAQRPFVLMSPHTRAHLLLSDGTVTGKYSGVLLYEASAKPLLEYIRRKNEWNESTLQIVNWEAHATAINRTSMPHTHVVKLLHRILPTFSQLNKFNGGNRSCILCGSLHEDHYHILRCPHSTRTAWRNDFLIGIRDFCISSNTSPLLCRLLLDGLRQWLRSTTKDIDIRPDHYHPTLRHIITQQNKIGWAQLFLGRFSVAWSLCQKRYLEAHGEADDTDRSCSLWQANLIRFVWERWYTLWKARNQEIHGHDKRTRLEAAKREARRKLNEIYSNRSMYEANVQTLLHREVDDHTQQPVSIINNWLSLNGPIFRESYRRVKRQAAKGMRSIRDYFNVP
jgi:exonuclease III